MLLEEYNCGDVSKQKNAASVDERSLTVMSSLSNEHDLTTVTDSTITVLSSLSLRKEVESEVEQRSEKKPSIGPFSMVDSHASCGGYSHSHPPPTK